MKKSFKIILLGRSKFIPLLRPFLVINVLDDIAVFVKEIVQHSSLNDGKGTCNLSALVIPTSDMESRIEEEQTMEVHS